MKLNISCIFFHFLSHFVIQIHSTVIYQNLKFALKKTKQNLKHSSSQNWTGQMCSGCKQGLILSFGFFFFCLCFVFIILNSISSVFSPFQMAARSSGVSIPRHSSHPTKVPLNKLKLMLSQLHLIKKCSVMVAAASAYSEEYSELSQVPTSWDYMRRGSINMRCSS